MKILVFIKEILDIKPQLFLDESKNIKKEWAITLCNPQDENAIMAALKIKEKEPESKVILIHLGPPEAERFLRNCIAYGCDEGILVWEDGLNSIKSHTKSFIFSRIAQILGFDLILTGTKSMDTGNGMVPILMARKLNLPYATSIINFNKSGNFFEGLKNLDSGYTATIRIPLPAVIGMDISDENLKSAMLSNKIKAFSQTINHLNLADIGLTWTLIKKQESLLQSSLLGFPAPKHKKVQPPNPELPGFLRTQKLIQGNIKKRDRKIINGRTNEIVEELFKVLQENGWIDHLKNE